MFLIALIALALSGTAVTLLARAGALPRMRAARRLDQIAAYGGAAGSIGGEEPSRNSMMLLGVAGRLGSVVARLAGAKEDVLRRELLAAGIYRVTPTALLGYRVLATLLLPALAVLAAPEAWSVPMRLAVVALACWCGWALPVVLLQRRARKRLYDIDYALPGMIDLLVVTVEAGLGFSSALKVAAEKLQEI